MSVTRRDFLRNLGVAGAAAVITSPATAQDKTPIEIQPDQKEREEKRRVLPFETFLQRLPPHDVLYVTEALEQDSSQGGERQRFTLQHFAELGLQALNKAHRPGYETIHTDYFPRGIPEQELEEFQRTGLTSMESTPQMCIAFLSYPYHPSCYDIATKSVKHGLEVMGLPQRRWVRYRDPEILDPVEQATALMFAGGENLSRSIKAAMPLEEVAELERTVYRMQTDDEHAALIAETLATETRPGARGVVYSRGLTTESPLPFLVSNQLRDAYGLRTTILELVNPSVDVITDENRQQYEEFFGGRNPGTLRTITAIPIAERHHAVLLPKTSSR
ncbi:MAG: twin-arginine translocation signal domain-containing protein [Nanoarchaeota archaeon]